MLLVAIVCAALCLASAHAQVPPKPEPAAMVWVSGTTVHRGKSKGQRYVMNASLVVPGNPSTPGASAEFGVDDQGRVMWIGQTDYQPTQGHTTVRRNFETPAPPMTTEQGPRYVMVCSWPLNADRKQAGPIQAGYAERDDSRASVSHDGTLQESISMSWTAVPAARARDKFAAHDFCGEVAKTKNSSAPRWLLEGKNR
ncbi:MAG: hypothetical protein QFF03_07885 [Pseudomonadota bacterium]|nr:hypothetical protein [Pseudomonadota bacterium]